MNLRASFDHLVGAAEQRCRHVKAKRLCGLGAYGHLKFGRQLNGKLRGRVTLPADAGEAQVVAAALAAPHIQAHLAGRPIRKVVFVPGRMLNLIV